MGLLTGVKVYWWSSNSLIQVTTLRSQNQPVQPNRPAQLHSPKDSPAPRDGGPPVDFLTYMWFKKYGIGGFQTQVGETKVSCLTTAIHTSL
jgi:hypothetical protein